MTNNNENLQLKVLFSCLKILVPISYTRYNRVGLTSAVTIAWLLVLMIKFFIVIISLLWDQKTFWGVFFLILID